MKTKTTFLKAGLVALFLFIANIASAATFYTCISTPLTLSAGTAPAGITYSWDVRQGGTSISGYPSATPPAAFPTAGSYEVVLTASSDAASGSCPSDPVSNTIIVMAPLVLTLDAPSVAAYCAANGTVNSSDVGAPVTGTETAAITGNFLALSYTYSVVKDGGAPVNGTTVGTIAADGTFTLNTTTPGSYVITGTVKYIQGSNNANLLLGTGCQVTSTNTRTVVVTAQPGTPTVTIIATP
ncbi:MAG TPA: PKD domain-containing protein [Pedobacter sp.]|nr:PKD domain-containing protein [Pedobacter sp.]